MKIVICGGGIIGCSIAYYLSQRGVPCTVVERCAIACSASGKAGGFLARDWANHYELGELSTKSYDLIEGLMDSLPDECDYRKINTIQLTSREDHTTGLRRKASIPDWLDGQNIVDTGEMGTTKTTAQIHPYKFTHALINEAKKNGTEVKIGVVENLTYSDDGTKVTGVVVDDEEIPADVVVIALGPWSHQACRWLPIAPVKGQRAHSILLRPENDVTPHALFVDFRTMKGEARSPEVYPRPDGDVYICGMSDNEPLPTDPANVTPREKSCDLLQQMAGKLSSNLSAAPRQIYQACYLPNSPDGLPLIGKVSGMQGAYVAAGHSCWGILNSAATGLAMSELILDGQSTSLDLSAFNPGRLGRCASKKH